MSEVITIEAANRDDLYGISVFLDKSWRAEYRKIVSDDFLDNMKAEIRHEAFLKRFDGGYSEFWSMFLDGKMIGSSVFGKSFTEGFEDDGEITAIYLDSDFIGKGYGHTMFTAVEQALTEKGYKNLVLDLLANNTRAYNFYLKHGYSKVADRSIKLGEFEYPLVVMRKTV